MPKGFFFAVSDLSWMVMDGPSTGKYEVVYKNDDPECFEISGEETKDLSRASADRSSAESASKS